MDIDKVVATVAKTMLCGGILISCFFPNSSTVVMLSSLSALLGMLTLKLMSIFRNQRLTTLDIAESTERSFLIEIKKRVKSGKPFNDELINLSDNATNEAEDNYKVIHGLNRPIGGSSR